MSKYLESALKLHDHLVRRHWRSGLVGPDPGIRLNFRIGRFIKSATSFLPWKDDLYYLQGQGYWILGNWRLFDLTGDKKFQALATQASDVALSHQRSDGAWEYPNPEWKGRVATAEGTWGALGLVESYRQTGEEKYLRSVLKWHGFLTQTIGYRQVEDELAVHYFADRGSGRVPNNSAFVLRFLAELADATGDASYLGPCPGMVKFMQRAQLASGELPYVAASPDCLERRHFQCFQYNAFQCLDLMRFFELRGEEILCPLTLNLLHFLQTGLSPAGNAYYQCDVRHRTVTYHTAVLSAAFRTAQRHGAEDFRPLADRAVDYVLKTQHPQGGFSYSRGDYRVLSDHRSYPRYQAMIMFHLLSHEKQTLPMETTAAVGISGIA
jgi:hypothetical protein